MRWLFPRSLGEDLGALRGDTVPWFRWVCAEVEGAKKTIGFALGVGLTAMDQWGRRSRDPTKVWTDFVLAGRYSHTVRKALVLAGYRLRWLLRSGISSDTPSGTRRLSNRQKARKWRASYLPTAMSMLVSTCVHHMGILHTLYVNVCVCTRVHACVNSGDL